MLDGKPESALAGTDLDRRSSIDPEDLRQRCAAPVIDIDPDAILDLPDIADPPRAIHGELGHLLSLRLRLAHLEVEEGLAELLALDLVGIGVLDQEAVDPGASAAEELFVASADVSGRRGYRAETRRIPCRSDPLMTLELSWPTSVAGQRSFDASFWRMVFAAALN